MRHLMPWVLAVASALGGCIDDTKRAVDDDRSDGGVGAAVSASGGRLQAHFVRPTDGSAHRFSHFVDTLTGEPCDLAAERNSSNERIYCWPQSYGRLGFADAECAQPVVQLVNTDTRWVRTPTGAVRRAEAPRAQTQIYLNDSGRCQPVDLDGPLYDIEETWDLEALAGGELERIDSDETLGVGVFRGDDGSAAVHALYDSVADAECWPQETVAGLRCVTARSRMSDLRDAGYRSADCERLLMIDYPLAAVESVTDVMDGPDGFYRLALAPRDTPVAQLQADGRCELMPDFNPGRRTIYHATYYPRDAWPSLTRRRDGGPGLMAARLEFESQDLQGLAEAIAPGPYFVDEAMAADCRPLLIDGTLRCAPAFTPYYPGDAAHYRRIFSDAACQAPVLAMAEHLSAPNGVAFAAQAGPEVYSVGESLTQETYYRELVGCQALAPEDGLVYFKLTERDPGTLPELTITASAPTR